MRSTAAATSSRSILRAVSTMFTWSAARAASNSVWSIGKSGSGEAPESPFSPPEWRREAHDRRARRVRPPRELLRRMEGGLVEVVDDVLPDVLLRARELVEALADLGGEGAGGRRRAWHGGVFRSPPASSFRRRPGAAGGAPRSGDRA